MPKTTELQNSMANDESLPFCSILFIGTGVAGLPSARGDVSERYFLQLLAEHEDLS